MSKPQKGKSPKLHLVEKSKKEIVESVLTNIIKMLTERKLINKENMDDRIKKIIDTHADDMTYKVELDKFSNNDDKICAVKIIP